MCNTPFVYTTMLTCTATPVHTTAPVYTVYTTASACNATLVYTSVPACAGQLRTAKRHAKEVLIIECDVFPSSVLYLRFLLLLLLPFLLLVFLLLLLVLLLLPHPSP
eukprot:5278528-Pyramimonas_sp.AAC.1